jgi:dTMP kinase
MIIVIEGGDQAGKKTQSQMLARALRKQRLKTKIFSFPDYSTTIGQEIKKILEGKRKFQPQVIHCLLAANRWEKLDEIKSAQEKNSIVIMNRYYHSNLVYGRVNKMKREWLENLDAGLPKADLVILLDVTQKDAFDRKRIKRDRFEKNIEYYDKILKTYRQIAKKRRWQIVNASNTKKQIHKDIMEIFSKKIRT